jgi:hypothetical protein
MNVRRPLLPFVNIRLNFALQLLCLIDLHGV